jgi:hypothetical protein
MSHHVEDTTNFQRTLHATCSITPNDVARIGFSRNPADAWVSILKEGANPGEGVVDRVFIEGEDLFALRELLNELPEEAFVRPADPVERWSDGDLIRGTRPGTTFVWVYLREGGKWKTAHVSGGATFTPNYRASDEDVDRMLTQEYGAERWTVLFQKSEA